MKAYFKRLKTVLLCILLAAAVPVTGVMASGITAYAAVIKTGTVNVSATLNFRSGPGTSYTKVGILYNGDSGVILDEELASNGALWYKMNVDGLVGWAHSSYITVSVKSDTTDQDFQKYLEEQKFPASYHEALHALHIQYPNWVFEAQHTGLEWDDVIEAESRYGYNTVHDNSSPSSWKSTGYNAYSWVSGKWTEVDSGGWVAASSEIVEHYMDPRNFLDATYIFQFLEQSYDPNSVDQTKVRKELTSLVKNTFLAKTYTENNATFSYIDVILDAANKEKVSPHMLASMIIQEQGINGTGRCISGTVAGYVGYYNFFNIGAYKTSGMSAVERGLWYASGASNNGTSYNRPWNTRQKAIQGGAEYFYNRYIQKGQDTLYLKKFNVQGSSPYTNQYMTNVAGAASEGAHLAKGYSAESREAELVFKIPVFKNMPATACKKPTKDGSPNNRLETLEVAGKSLTPSYYMHTTSYEVTVDYDVETVQINAVPYDDGARVSGAGSRQLQFGENPITIKVTAENGDVFNYTITVIRKKPDLSALDANLERLSGSTRYETSIAIADRLKAVMDVDRFENVIIASGTSFPDALSGSYLASVKETPILLTDGTNTEQLKDYIRENVVPGGMVYILGGTAAVPETVDRMVEEAGYVPHRLSGADRYETNLLILQEAGMEEQDLLLCTGTNFADSLSASAAGRPILLVGDALSEDQKQVLSEVSGQIYIIGGTNAVSAQVAAEVPGAIRLSGADRYATSATIADTFFTDPTVVVLTSGTNFPDGLCGGVFAGEIQAPLLLTGERAELQAQAYTQENEIRTGVVLGGSNAISDGVICTIWEWSLIEK